MLQRKATLLLIICLTVHFATAARKAVKPVKPVKTFLRSNVTPAPTTPAAAAAAASSTLATSQSSSAQLITKNSEQELGTAGYAPVSDLPKPLSTFDPEDVITPTTQTNPRYTSESTSSEEECDPDMIGFEIITGSVFTAPTRILETQPGTLMLTDCLESCQSNGSCTGFNYETGLCVLFSANADTLPGSLSRSQFPVFTIYGQKTCLGLRPCTKAWCIDRVQGYRLLGHVKRSLNVYTRRDCLELCLGENEFICRSANFYHHSGLCELSDLDRITLTGGSDFEQYDGADYLENHCAEEPNKLCEFKRISGKILKTVDSVYQDVGSIDECRDLCLNSPYRCHSYDYNDTGDMVCRLSHHSRATLTDVLDPYLDVPEAATYELSSCYNVSIECRAGEMITRIRTSKLFDGKVYAKGAPKSCSIDIDNALDFDFRMGYNDVECNVRQSAYGRYVNDIVIQHHDMIVTSSDLGLAVSCQYDLTNKTVSNDVDLGVHGDIETSMSEEIMVDSPNVIMKITSRDGSDMMRSAEVGDQLALRFEILEKHSPYEIFVRDLRAMDGTDNAEIVLIDSRGCPTDQYIMGSIQKSAFSQKVLLTVFDAFKFPSSPVVQFRALVTPCMPHCEPVHCDQHDTSSGEFKSLLSFGRRRRSVNATEDYRRSKREADKPSNDDMLLVQTIQISDKFGFDQDNQSTKTNNYNDSEKIFTGIELFGCLNGYGLISAGAIFLLAQIVIILVFKQTQRRHKKAGQLFRSDTASSFGSAMMHAPLPPQHCDTRNRGDNLSKLYDSGMVGRYGNQF